jgi:hypothetical protein
MVTEMLSAHAWVLFADIAQHAASAFGPQGGGDAAIAGELKFFRVPFTPDVGPALLKRCSPSLLYPADGAVWAAHQ